MSGPPVCASEIILAFPHGFMMVAAAPDITCFHSHEAGGMNPARTTVPFFDLLLADFSGGFPPQYWHVSKVKGVECHEEAGESVCSSLGAELCLPLRQAPGVCLHVLICTLIHAARQESCLRG